MFITLQCTIQGETSPVYVDVDKVCYIYKSAINKDKVRIGFGYGGCEVDGDCKAIKEKIIKARKGAKNV